VAVIGKRRVHLLRRGAWEHLGLDRAGALSASVSDDDAGKLPVVAAASFAADDALWLGGVDGLARIAPEFRSAPARVRSGLPSTQVTALAPLGSGILVGTTAGLALCAADGCRALAFAAGAALPPAQVFSLDVREEDDGRARIAVADVRGVHVLTRAGPDDPLRATTVATDAVKRALFFGAEEIVTWTGAGLFTILVPRRADGTLVGGASARPIAHQGDIKKSRLLLDVAVLRVDGAETLAVTTDVGVTFWQHRRFQTLEVDHLFALDTQPIVARALTWRAPGSGADQLVLLASQGVGSWQPGRSHVVTQSRVLLTVPELGLTFVALDEGLYAIRHDDPAATPVLVDYGSVRNLARDPRGGVLASAGFTVLRYDPETGRATELFQASPTDAPRWAVQPITSLLVARDGAVWAVAGPSVFRFIEGAAAPLTEWSIYKDAKAFPARSQ
jgi:hypothetical protein